MNAEAAPTMSQYEADRRNKMERLRELGVDPFGHRFADHTPIVEAVAAFRADAEPDQQARVRVAGRLMAVRRQGKSCFCDLRDWTGKVQVFLGKKQVGEDAYEIVKLLDLSDHIGVAGRLGKTRTGEITVFADTLVYLAKALTPPPEKWHGLTDVEARYRQRYVDLSHNPAVREAFVHRSKMLQETRRFLQERGFLEVETPAMQAIAGGAAARPFITHHNTLEMDLFLRISPELYLKRLLVGGMERVFELGRVFRNEGISTKHNPEFTLLEVYQAYADYHDMMELTEGLILRLIEAVGGGLQRTWDGTKIDFTPPWPRKRYAELLQEHAGVSLDDPAAARRVAQQHGLEVEGKHDDVVVNDLFEECVEPHLRGPVFVLDYPASLCPLTRRHPENADLALRFELFIMGMEMANAYTELNDPDIQSQAFQRQLEGQEETMATMDEDFVQALKCGMPPAGGLGIGMDRLVMLLTDQKSIRDVILFPLLRPTT